MWNPFKRKEAIEPEPEPFIGIALFTTYTSCMGMGTFYHQPSTTICNGPGFGARDFFEFTAKDVTERRKTECKIMGAWLENKDVLFYSDIKTPLDKQVFINKMSKKYQVSKFGDTHKLYDHGLDVSYNMFGSENHFHDKKLERKIDKEINEIINERIN